MSGNLDIVSWNLSGEFFCLNECGNPVMFHFIYKISLST